MKSALIFLLLASCQVNGLNESLRQSPIQQFRSSYQRATEPECTEIGLFCHDCKTLVMCVPSGSSFVPYDSTCADTELCVTEGTNAQCVEKTITANADDDCVCESEPGFAADPFDTSKFVMCFSGNFLSQSCPEGELFSTDTNECEPSDESAESECTEAGFVAVDDCKNYLVCYEQNGKFESFKMSCDDKFFDESQNQCVATITAPVPVSSCPADVNGLVEDTFECNAYYLCPSETLSKQCCPAGLLFDSKLQICKEDDGTITCPVVNDCADTSGLTYECSELMPTTSSSESTASSTGIESSESSSASSSIDPDSSDASSAEPSSTVSSSSTDSTSCTYRDIQEYPGDCNKFMYCLKPSGETDPVWTTMNCPGTTEFNPILKYCMLAENAGCVQK